MRRQKRTWHDVAGDHGKLMVRPQNHKDHKGRRTNTTPCGATWAEQRDIHPKSPTLLLDRAFCYWFPFFESSRPQTNTIPNLLDAKKVRFDEQHDLGRNMPRPDAALSLKGGLLKVWLLRYHREVRFVG